MWLIILSDQLPVFALVSHYLTNKLIGREPILRCQAVSGPQLSPRRVVSGISTPFGMLSRAKG